MALSSRNLSFSIDGIFVASALIQPAAGQRDSAMVLLPVSLPQGKAEIELHVEVQNFDSEADGMSSRDGQSLAYVIQDIYVLPAEPRVELPSSTWCIFPFVSNFVDEDLTLGSCCIESGSGRRVNGARENIVFSGPESLREGWVSSQAKEVREQMLLGKEPKNCAACFTLEKSGGRSVRNLGNKKFLPIWKSFSGTENCYFPAAEYPSVLDIKLGNLCNLTCRMCGPKASFALEADYKAMFGVDSEKFRHSPWMKGDAAVKMIRDCIDHVRFICVAGGEPFLTPNFKLLLDLIAERGKCQDTYLEFHTNGTRVNPDFFPLFSQFKRLDVVVSMDGVGAVNEYIRPPSKFADVKRGVDLLYGALLKKQISNLSFNTTVQ